MTITTLIGQFGQWVGMLTGILAALALLVFIWGLVKYIWAAGSDEKASGKNIMVGGVVALFVLFSVFGIVRFLQRSFGTVDTGGLPPPAVRI
jgi:TRAP-type C4-dicarboxylate transport system permease small subunit